MSTGRKYKRLKRRFKKKLYHFLVALNDFDFSRLRPVCYLLLTAGILFGWTKLPTKETTPCTPVSCPFSMNLPVLLLFRFVI